MRQFSKVILLLAIVGFLFGQQNYETHYGIHIDQNNPDVVMSWSKLIKFNCSSTPNIDYSNKEVFGLFGDTDGNVTKTITAFGYPHHYIRVELKILFVGEVDPNDSVDISLDSTVFNFKRSEFQRKGSICTDSDTDSLIYLNKKIPHFTNNLTLGLKANVVKSPTKGVIYDFLAVLVEQCTGGCAQCTSEGCTVCVVNADLVGKICVCRSGLPVLKGCAQSCYLPEKLSGTTCKLPESCRNCGVSCEATKYCPSCGTKLFLNKSNCARSCPEGTYHDRTNPSSFVCGDCHSECKSCTGGKFNECTSCKEPFKFNNKTYNCGQCSEKAGLTTCVHCHSSCERCDIDSEGSTDCITCAAGMKKIYQTQQCVLSSPDAHFLNLSDEFQPCDPACKSCQDIGPNSCTSCESPKLLDRMNKRCVDTCADNQYLSDGVCEMCNDSCLKCFGSGEFQCTSCSSPSYIRPYDHSCVFQCGAHFILVENQCLQCHESCNECSGTRSDQCLSCSSPKFFERSTSTCVDDCGSHSYGQNNVCGDCHEQCLGCSGPTQKECTSCDTKYQLQNKQCILICDPLYLKDNSCIETCGTHYYAFDHVCEKCSESCLDCFGPKENECTSCSAGVLKNSSCIAEQDYKDNPDGSEALSEYPNSIEVEFQISFYIFLTISSSWVASLVFGHFKDQLLMNMQARIQSSTKLEKGGVLTEPRLTKMTIPDTLTQPNIQTETEFLQTEPIEKPNNILNNPSHNSNWKSIFRCSILGNEWVQFIMYSDPKASRVFRASAIFIKQLGYAFVCKEFAEGSIVLGVLIAIIGGGTMKSAVLGIPKLFDKYHLSFMSQRVISISCIALGITSQITQMLSMSQSKDENSSLGFCVAFFIDLLAVQQVIGAVKYFSTIHCMKKGSNSKIATFFKDPYIVGNLSSI